jgi:hypothetical protein
MKEISQVLEGVYVDLACYGTFGINTWINSQRYFFKAKQTKVLEVGELENDEPPALPRIARITPFPNHGLLRLHGL